MSDIGFEALLAQHNQEYRDAEEFSDWMPPDGEHLVTVLKCSKGVSTKDQKQTGWWKLTAQLIAPESPELDGQEFTLGFYRTSAMGILKGQARALNGGEAVASLAEANQVIEGSVGKVLKVKIVTKTNAKNGKDYTNCYVQEVIAVTDAVVENSEPPQEETAPSQV